MRVLQVQSRVQLAQRHSREGGNPVLKLNPYFLPDFPSIEPLNYWIPAFAGMTL
jgi:hypothetical protein